MGTTIHFSARLAWHADGWNGHICKEPYKNIYCTGQYSYPGKMYENKKEQMIDPFHALSNFLHWKLNAHTLMIARHVWSISTSKMRQWNSIKSSLNVAGDALGTTTHDPNANTVNSV